ncbi:unnamed protein product [Eruca vesicaria subsp. sativa]|uniref:Uncharacterized protein n=1 Tax=Eruca vesicaria subsp. sativa TaxID=29727 RepID=A0ABC8KYW3_ERUVS|nr:unnamed protein product [Eruca vesicaria subsp. sativa]
MSQKQRSPKTSTLLPRTEEPVLNTSYQTPEGSTMTGAPPPEQRRAPLKVDLARSERCLKVNSGENLPAPHSPTHLTTTPEP